jgi:hypothetical protein
MAVGHWAVPVTRRTPEGAINRAGSVTVVPIEKWDGVRNDDIKAAEAEVAAKDKPADGKGSAP